MYHKPILVNEILDIFNLKKNMIVADCTTGEGGHSLKFAPLIPDGKLICIDRDKNILEEAKKNLSYYENIHFVKGNFKAIKQIMNNLQITGLDRILIDLGISIYHYKASGRGFSFQENENIDMRLDDDCFQSVHNVINTFDEKELAMIIKRFSEERFANRIAKKIVQERKSQEILYSKQLSDIIYNAIPKKFHSKHIHPATKTFQALRIFVNDELTGLEEALTDCINLLKKDGIIAVISFHSLEDRIVKRTFNQFIGKCTCPPESPVCNCDAKRVLNILSKKPIIPSKEEIDYNPSSRSAKLRVAQKV